MAGARDRTGARGRRRHRARRRGQCRRRPSVAFERLERRRRHPGPGAAQHERPLQRDGCGQGRRQAGLGSRVARPSRSCRRARHRQPFPDDRQVGFVELLRAANDRGEQEERETEHEEHVADRSDVLDDREGDRDDVGERPEMEEEVGVERRGQDVVKGRRDIGRGQTGGGERRFPDRHVAAVDDDHDRVRQDPDEDEDHARVPAVRPQGHEEEPEGPGQERESERLDRGTPALRRNSVTTRSRSATASSSSRRSRIEARLTRLPPAIRPRTSPRTMPPISTVECPGSREHHAWGRPRRAGSSRPGRRVASGPGIEGAADPAKVVGLRGARWWKAERPSGRLRPDRPASRPWRRCVRRSSDRPPARSAGSGEVPGRRRDPRRRRPGSS